MVTSALVRWIRAAVLAALVALPVPGVTGAVALTVAATAAATVALAPSTAWARRGFSGGYFRPSFSRSFSFGRRMPSFSGGYGRPRTPGVGSWSWRSPRFGTSAGDKAFSRRASGSALGNYRSRQRTASAGVRGASGFGRAGNASGWGRSAGWYTGRGWSIPRYAYYGPPRFGMWNALFLWFMLDHLSRPGNAAFFYNHQNDPGYQQWRSTADQQAQDNPALKSKLNKLDADLVAQQGEPRNPNYMPPDVPAEAALAGQGAAPRAPGGGVPWLVPLLAGVLFLLWRGRQRLNHPQPAGHPRPRRDGPSSFWFFRRKGQAMNDPLQTVGNFFRRKTSDERYRPALFRVGMTLNVDPTPFLLARDVAKVSPPTADTDQMTSVEAVGTLDGDTAILSRLYLPGGETFFQIHLDRSGQPDECRYFTVIDEVYPADAEEWAFWLDEAEGMIGWSEFQTKDGKTYGRVWTPGLKRSRPLSFEEKVESVGKPRTLSSLAMLYGAPTGAPPPAPQTEFILVSAIEEGQQAWIQIAAGIDVNPASLSLS